MHDLIIVREKYLGIDRHVTVKFIENNLFLNNYLIIFSYKFKFA